jgi:hypothetical protein
MSQSEEHLRLLSIFHYVLAGILGLFSFLPAIHLGLGILMLAAPEEMSDHGEPPPEFLAWAFIIGGGTAIVLGLTLSILIAVSGRCIARRRKLLFSTVIAGIECVFMPLGTILGVFTLITLTRTEVKQLYGQGPSSR